MSEETIQAVEDILRAEVEKLRKNSHDMAGEISVLKLQVYKLENKSPICGEHAQLTTTLTKIECAVANIEKGIMQNGAFKNAIVGSLIGMACIIAVQLGGFLFLYGKMVNQIEVNSGRLNRIESWMTSDRTTQK